MDKEGNILDFPVNSKGREIQDDSKIDAGLTGSLISLGLSGIYTVVNVGSDNQAALIAGTVAALSFTAAGIFGAEKYNRTLTRNRFAVSKNITPLSTGNLINLTAERSIRSRNENQ